MVPVKIGDLVLGDGSDDAGHAIKIVGMVVSSVPFKEQYHRWMVEWSDGEKTTHPTNSVRSMKDRLKRYMTEEI